MVAQALLLLTDHVRDGLLGCPWHCANLCSLGKGGYVFVVATVYVVSRLLPEFLHVPEVPFTLPISKSCLPGSLIGRGCSIQLVGRLWVWVPTASLTMGEPVHCWGPLISGGLLVFLF